MSDSATTDDGDGVTPSLLRLVEQEARAVGRLLPREAVEHQDLVGFGHVGLLEAKGRFDPRRGVNFESFARHRIRGAIFDGLRRCCGLFSRRTYQRLRRQVVAWGIAGDPVPLADDEETRRRVAEVTYQAIADLAMAIAAETCAQESAPNPEEQAMHQDDLARMREAIGKLGEDDRQLLDAIYAFGGDDDALRSEHLAKLGVHRSTFSRRHRRVLKRLRRLMAGLSI